MKKMKVSKEFIEEFERLNKHAYSLHNGLNMVTFEDFPTLKIFLHDAFKNDEQCNQNQLTFAKIWAGEIELVEKEEQYIVWVKGSKTKKEWASFMHVEDDNTIDISYDSLFDMAKGNPGFHFSKEKAFKLRDTGYFEIERVDE